VPKFKSGLKPSGPPEEPPGGNKGPDKPVEGEVLAELWKRAVDPNTPDWQRPLLVTQIFLHVIMSGIINHP
jgi:hypothetical protein